VGEFIRRRLRRATDDGVVAEPAHFFVISPSPDTSTGSCGRGRARIGGREARLAGCGLPRKVTVRVIGFAWRGRSGGSARRQASARRVFPCGQGDSSRGCLRGSPQR